MIVGNTTPKSVGNPIPYAAHAISVSLPTWADTVNYKLRDPHTLELMQTGYPRYFIHLSIRKVGTPRCVRHFKAWRAAHAREQLIDLYPYSHNQLAKLCEKCFGTPSERALLLHSCRAAEACRAFMTERSAGPIRIVHLQTRDAQPCAQTYVVFFPVEAFPIAKLFWEYTGLGISSRLAEYCFALLIAANPSVINGADGDALSSTNSNLSVEITSISPRNCGRVGNQEGRHYLQTAAHALDLEAETISATDAKILLRRRIASLISAPDNEIKSREFVQYMEVTDGDVFLYPTGMAAIWSAHQLCMGVFGERKRVCFGFPYADTLKVLEKWGPGCYFFADGQDSSIDELEAVLLRPDSIDSSTPPVIALFTEFPSNPHLRSVNLPRLRELANKHDFLIVIDDTIGNPFNVHVLPYADIVVTSLTKFFSGAANVMGGSLALNRNCKHYEKIRAHMQHAYEDVYFHQDAIVMERNSRDFERRIAIINANAEALCDFIRSGPFTVVSDVLYPKWQTSANYNACHNRSKSGKGRYGGVFSLMFPSEEAARAFFDALPCFKGPSLGTNFTLACPYAILAHFHELDWAARYGAPAKLVRISVGLEDREELLEGFASALQVAEQVHKETLKTCSVLADVCTGNLAHRK